MRKLTPPLTVIEASLFDPSLSLIQRCLDGDPELSSVEKASLTADEAFQSYLRASDETQITGDETAFSAPAPLPNRLAEKIRQRVAAQELNLKISPAPGLIVRIDQAIGPEGPLPWDMSRPFVALLSKPTEHPEIWYGWLMSSETDYAGHWDLLLEEADQPYDPVAAMVQTWNPVHLYSPAISASLGHLSPERLAAVRTLACDLGGAQPDTADAAPGTLVHRTTSAGHLVLTGSPLGDDTDPRWRYQELYFEAGEFVRAMARNALEQFNAHQARSWWRTILADLKARTQEAGISLTTVTEAALGDEAPLTAEDADRNQALRIGDMVELRFLPSPDGDALQIHVRLVQEATLHVGLARGEQVRQQAWLTRDASETDLFVGIDQALTFFIRDKDDQIQFSMDLGNVLDPH